MAVYANLTVDQGTDFSSAIDVTDSDGDPVSLVGYTVFLHFLSFQGENTHSQCGCF